MSKVVFNEEIKAKLKALICKVYSKSDSSMLPLERILRSISDLCLDLNFANSRNLQNYFELAYLTLCIIAGLPIAVQLWAHFSHEIR